MCPVLLTRTPSSSNAQTTRCAAITGRVVNQDVLVRFDFFAAITSRYYAALALGIGCENWEMGNEALNKNGHFEVLAPDKRGNEAFSKLLKYDVSWVLN